MNFSWICLSLSVSIVQTLQMQIICLCACARLTRCCVCKGLYCIAVSKTQGGVYFSPLEPTAASTNFRKSI